MERREKEAKKRKTVGDVKVVQDTDAWSMTNWFSLDDDRRLNIYQRLRSKTWKKEQQKQKVEVLLKHDEADAQRQKDKATVAANRDRNKRLNYERRLEESKTKLAKTASELMRLMKNKSDAQQCEVLRDQMRIREGLYGIKKPDKVGSGGSAAELQRLRAAVVPLVKEKLPPRKPPPMPLAERSLVAVPDGASRSLTGAHVGRQLEALELMRKMVSNGVFRMKRAPGSRRQRKRSTREPPKKQVRALNAKECALGGGGV